MLEQRHRSDRRHCHRAGARRDRRRAAVVRARGRGGGRSTRCTRFAASRSRRATRATCPSSTATATRSIAASRCTFPAPHSYTGEHVLELQGHGGPIVLQLVLQRAIEAGREFGLRLAEPGEFTRRAFLNDKLDLAQAEAVADLIEASTEAAARSAGRSLDGAFSREIHALVEDVITLRMLVEATLDFPEEEIDFLEAADARGKLTRIRERLDTCSRDARQGALLREGLVGGAGGAAERRQVVAAECARRRGAGDRHADRRHDARQGRADDSDRRHSAARDRYRRPARDARTRSSGSALSARGAKSSARMSCCICSTRATGMTPEDEAIAGALSGGRAGRAGDEQDGPGRPRRLGDAALTRTTRAKCGCRRKRATALRCCATSC